MCPPAACRLVRRQRHPDITLVAPDGSLHLFDAKLKVDFTTAADADDTDARADSADTFKREDLYKMHAYRDAFPPPAH